MRPSIPRTIRCLYWPSPPRTAVLTTSNSTPTIRAFTTTTTTSSGHNRWSKIKHDKAKTDSRRGASFSKLSQEISYASREGGIDSNLRLNAAVAAAKKAGMAKDKINIAVQRGQGKSTSGAALDPVLVEAMGPGNVAFVIDCLTDNKLRALQDIKLVLSKHGAHVGPTNYLFSRKGVVRVIAGSGGHVFGGVLEIALEVEGTEDVEEIEGENGKPEILITTEPSRTGSVATEVKGRLPGLQIASCGIEWVPNEDTMMDVSGETEASLAELIERLEETPDVTDVYTNAKT